MEDLKDLKDMIDDEVKRSERIEKENVCKCESQLEMVGS